MVHIQNILNVLWNYLAYNNVYYGECMDIFCLGNSRRNTMILLSNVPSTLFSKFWNCLPTDTVFIRQSLKHNCRWRRKKRIFNSVQESKKELNKKSIFCLHYILCYVDSPVLMLKKKKKSSLFGWCQQSLVIQLLFIKSLDKSQKYISWLTDLVSIVILPLHR